MKDAKLELKKVKMFKCHDGIGLDCDLYVDGKKVCHVFDSAHGGGNEYHAYGPDYKANNKIIQDLEEYAKTLPETPSSYGGTLKQDLDSIINDILMKMEKEKMQKKSEKKFGTHIIVGVPEGNSVREYAYGKPARALNTLPKAKLQADFNTIKASLKEGEQILNTNLQDMGIVL